MKGNVAAKCSNSLLSPSYHIIIIVCHYRPLLLALLKYLANPLAKLGLIPEFIAKRLGIQVNDTKNKTTIPSPSVNRRGKRHVPSNANATTTSEVVTIESTDKYRILLKENAFVIVKFTAEWCAPCKQIHPFYQSLQSRFSHIVFAVVDVDDDECDDIMLECKVSAMPTFVTFRDGIRDETLTGSNEGQLEDLVGSLH